MSLFSATLIPGIFLLILGCVLLWKGKRAGGALKLFPRSQRAAYVTLGLAAVWTLYHISQLGEADMGNYKRPLFVGFAGLAVLAFKYAPDFLSVRGSCALFLLIADVLLSSAYMHYEFPQRLFLVYFVYLGILFSLYLAIAPFRLRDFLDWLCNQEYRSRFLGGLLSVYGLILASVSFTY
jgi:hypothetical protein